MPSYLCMYLYIYKAINLSAVTFYATISAVSKILDISRVLYPFPCRNSHPTLIELASKSLPKLQLLISGSIWNTGADKLRLG